VAFVPYHRTVESDSARHTAFVLHGALGSGRNFSGFIRSLSRERPDYRYVLVDLRHHGSSGGAPPPNTLAACAADLAGLAAAIGREPRVVIGHSFGGKVAIEYARRGAAALEQVWVLDSLLGAGDELEDTEIARVIRAVRSVPMPAASRRDVTEHLVQQSGLSSGLAEWMATNLARVGERYEWVFDLDAIEELMLDYFRVDTWGYLAEPRERPEFRLVVAERSDRWTAELRERAKTLPSSARVVYHELERSGHWVHVDNPDGLLALLREHLV
jgi:pimeloyl-ACP methyl ester carboxylesterase